MRCVVCRKANATAREMCAGCNDRFKAIYGKEGTNMAKTTKASNVVALPKNKAAAKPKPAPVVVEPEETELDQIAEEANAERFEDDAAELEDEAREDLEAEQAEQAAEEEAEEGEAAPSSGKGRVHPDYRSPKAVARRVKLAIERLERVDWTALNVPEGPRAIATLRLALPKLESMKATPGGRKVAEGKTARVKDTARARYEGILETEDMDGLKVVALRKNTAVCRTPAGEKIMIPVRHIEAVVVS